MLIYAAIIDSEEEKTKFELIYQQYRHLMYNIAYEILHDEHYAEDVVHDAFVKIIENLEKVDIPVSAKTQSYVVTITENRAIDIYRRQKRHPEVPYGDAGDGIHVEIESTNDLVNCIGKLPARYRQVLVLKYRHGYTSKEIAKILGISKANAIKLEQRAKAMLGKICMEEGVL